MTCSGGPHVSAIVTLFNLITMGAFIGPVGDQS